MEAPAIVIALFANLALAIEPANLSLAIEPASIAFVTLPLSPVLTKVPATSGSVSVLSAVELATRVVVVSAAVPSKSNVNPLVEFVVNLTVPVPLAPSVRSTFVSPPVAVILGLPLVAAFVTVISLTAVPV